MIRIEAFHNQLIPKLRINWDGTLGKNPEGLIRPAYKLAKSVTKTSSKIWELKTYDETISNFIHGNRQKEAIDEKLWNLDFYHTWSYTNLPSRQKIIGYK